MSAMMALLGVNKKNIGWRVPEYNATGYYFVQFFTADAGAAYGAFAHNILILKWAEKYLVMRFTTNKEEYELAKTRAISCHDLLIQGKSKSGVTEVSVNGRDFFSTYCDQDQDGGGWTLAARLGKNSTFHGDPGPVHPEILARASGEGKLSDLYMYYLAKGREYRIECGGSKYFLKQHEWRSHAAQRKYLFSSNGKDWIKGRQRLTNSFQGWDNYDWAIKVPERNLLIYRIKGEPGCQDSNGPNQGRLWLR